MVGKLRLDAGKVSPAKPKLIFVLVKKHSVNNMHIFFSQCINVKIMNIAFKKFIVKLF